MADPIAYGRDYSFSGFQATAPQTPLPGPKVDNELSNVEASTASLVAAVKDIRRSDGKLKNSIVTRESLSADVVLGVPPAVEWATATPYVSGESVFYLTGFFRCVVSHTSGVFDTDFDAGYWELFADLEPWFSASYQPLAANLSTLAGLPSIANLTSIAGLASIVALTALAGLAPANNKLPYFNGASTAALADLTAAGRSIIGALDAAAQTALLSAFIGSGASHAKGLVPDPGATPGTTKYLREDGTWATIPAGGARNFIQTMLTATFTTASTSYTDVTGGSVQITPSSTASRVLVRLSGVLCNSTASGAAFLKLVRGSTDIAIGDAAGNRIRATAGQRSTAEEGDNFGVAFIDSPASASLLTYKLQLTTGGSGVAVLGRHGTDNDSVGYGRYPTILSVEEIQ